LILSDVRMPRLDGLQLLNWVKRQPSFAPVPFLLMTSGRSPENQATAEQFGADEFLVKPATLDGLSRLVKSILDRWCISAREKAALRAAIAENRRLTTQLTDRSLNLMKISERMRRSAAAEAPSDSEPGADSGRSNQRKLFVLVGSNPDEYRRVDQCLWKAAPSSRVRWARDARETIQIVDEVRSGRSRVCVVLLWSQSGQDTFEMIESIRAARPLVPLRLALLSERFDKSQRDRADLLGVDACIAIPSTRVELSGVAAVLQELAADS
jgi:CheY-like chemotaxis protein